jgi:hypothetical protein
MFSAEDFAQKHLKGSVSDLSGVVHRNNELEVGHPDFFGEFHGPGDKPKVVGIGSIHGPSVQRLEVLPSRSVSQVSLHASN